MTLVALASIKASPGVTTLALALAGVWPTERSALLAEIDPAGGDLCGRFAMAHEPGLVTLAASARRDGMHPDLLAHCQQLPGGLPLLAGPPSAEQVRTAISVLGAGLPGALRRADYDVIADVGRLDPGSVALAAFSEADASLVLARPNLAELNHLAAARPALCQGGRGPLLVLAGEGDYEAAEIERAVGLEVVGTIAADPQAAALLSGRSGSERLLARSALVRSARELVSTLLARLEGPSLTEPERLPDRAQPLIEESVTG